MTGWLERRKNLAKIKLGISKKETRQKEKKIVI